MQGRVARTFFMAESATLSNKHGRDQRGGRMEGDLMAREGLERVSAHEVVGDEGPNGWVVGRGRDGDKKDTAGSGC